MTASVLISILLAVLYTSIAAARKKTVPDSLSAMVYTFGTAGRWTWIIWLWACTITLTPALMDAVPEPFKIVGFITVVLLLFTGAMPLVAGEKNTAHYVLAILAGITSQVAVAITSPWCLVLWGAFAAAILWAWHRGGVPKCCENKGIFIIETICWLTTIGSIIIH